MELTPDESKKREQIMGFLMRHLQAVVAMAGLPIDEGRSWGIRHISWNGVEWPGLEGRKGLCFVVIYYLDGSPDDHLIVLDFTAGTCAFAATYRQEANHLRLLRSWPSAMGSPAFPPLTNHVPSCLLPTKEVESAATMDGHSAMEDRIRRNIKRIAKQSALVGVDDHHWDVTRISWTGEEWPGLRPIPGHCYVEAFEHGVPPHDFLYVVSVHSGSPEFFACYEGGFDSFHLTIYRPEFEAMGLPDQVERSA